MPQVRRRRPKAGDAEYPFIYKKYRYGTVRSRYPVFTHAWSKKQKAVRNRVREASAYAVAVAADPEAVAYYTEVIRRKKKRGLWTVRNAAMADFFNVPIISELEVKGRRGQPGAELTAHVAQKFDDATVRVSLRSGKRELQPEVPATYDAPLWKYRFDAPLPEGDGWEIVVTAQSRPGHRTTAIVNGAQVTWIETRRR
jgi:hypothetical protein